MSTNLGTPTQTNLMTKKRLFVIFVVFLVNFVSWIDESILGILTPYWSTELNLDAVHIAGISSAYLLGYFPILFLAGVLSDRLGAKKMLLISVAGTTIMSAATLLCQTYSQLWLRNFLFGIFFGFMWAPCNKMMAMWLPSKERAQAGGLWLNVTLLAIALGAPISLPLAEALSWRPVFLVVTLVGIPTFLLLLKTKDHPEDYKGISKQEIDYINMDRVPGEIEAGEFRWSHLLSLFKDLRLWAMVIVAAACTTPTWLIGTWGSIGLIKGYGLSPSTVSWLIPLMTLIPIVAGFGTGLLVKVCRGKLKIAIAVTPILCGFAYLLVGTIPMHWFLWSALIYGVAYICDPWGWGCVGAYWAGYAKPEYSGTLNGLGASLQVAVGYVIVLMSGKWVTDAPGVASLNKVWVIGAVIWFCTLLFVFFGKEVKVRLDNE